jgi:hypothetical protein
MHPEARKTLVKALCGKKTFDYLYDFGDSWDHRIKVEKRLPAITAPQLPYCIEGANACPPEDVGGAPGYADFLEVMADPKHPEHDDMVAWHGEVFEPAAFDCARVNQWLESIKV